MSLKTAIRLSDITAVILMISFVYVWASNRPIPADELMSINAVIVDAHKVGTDGAVNCTAWTIDDGPTISNTLNVFGVTE